MILQLVGQTEQRHGLCNRHSQVCLAGRIRFWSFLDQKYVHRRCHGLPHVAQFCARTILMLSDHSQNPPTSLPTLKRPPTTIPPTRNRVTEANPPQKSLEPLQRELCVAHRPHDVLVSERAAEPVPTGTTGTRTNPTSTPQQSRASLAESRDGT